MARTGPRDNGTPRSGCRGQRGTPSSPASAIRTVADGGLATITPDSPSQQRGITVSSIYVSANGNQLRKLAQRLEEGQLEIPIAASYRLANAAHALAQATGGHVGGAIVLTPYPGRPW